jgi:hypothetical protein
VPDDRGFTLLEGTATAAGRRAVETHLARRWDVPVTSSTATASPGGATCTSSGSGCVLTGPAPGTSCTVSVSAAHTTGPRPASSPGTGTT